MSRSRLDKIQKAVVREQAKLRRALSPAAWRTYLRIDELAHERMYLAVEAAKSSRRNLRSRKP